MTTPQPYVGLSPDRLTALINAKNALSLQMGVDFVLGPPQVYADGTGRNTKVILTPIDADYESAELHYWRLPLTVLNDLPSGYTQAVPIPSVPFTLHSLLPAINAALGLNLTADEVVDQTYSTQQSSYALHINQAVSYAWLDSAFTFAATFQTTPGGGSPYIGVRPGWFTQLNGMEAQYYPTTVGSTTWSAPLSETAGALVGAKSQWVAATNVLRFGGQQGALFDVAVLDPSTGLPAAKQPTSWAADTAQIAAPGTYQGYGYTSIYQDVEAFMIAAPGTASTDPSYINITGTYADGSTITAQMTLPPSLDLGDPLVLVSQPVNAWGIIANAGVYLNKDSKLFSVPWNQLKGHSWQSNQFLQQQVPFALMGQQLDSIFLPPGDNSAGAVSYMQGGQLSRYVSGQQGYTRFTVPTGSYIAATDATSTAVLQPDGVVTVVGTPTADSVIDHMPKGLTGITSLNINQGAAYGTPYGVVGVATAENGTITTYGNIMDTTTFQYAWGTQTYQDTKGVVAAGLYNGAVSYLDHTGEGWNPATSGQSGPPFGQVGYAKRISSVDNNRMGVGSDGDIWPQFATSAYTNTGNYAWVGGLGIVDTSGQLNLMDSSFAVVTIPSTVKRPPNDSRTYNYQTYASGFAQYTGATIPAAMRKRFYSPSVVIAKGGYASTIVTNSTGIPGALPYLEFNPTYGLGSLGAGGLALNLDGSPNQTDSQISAQADWSDADLTSVKYMQVGMTPNGQGASASSSPWPGIGLQFDGTVSTIGYRSKGLTLAAIYTAKKAKWLTNTNLLASAMGALLTVDGDILWYGTASWTSTTSQTQQVTLSDTAYQSTGTTCARLTMGINYLFGFDADGTAHEYDFPWNTSQSHPPLNVLASLPVTKLFDVIDLNNTIVAIAADKQTVYVKDQSGAIGANGAASWVQLSLTEPMTDWGFINGGYYWGCSFYYAGQSGALRQVTFVANSSDSTQPPTISDTLLAAGFVEQAFA